MNEKLTEYLQNKIVKNMWTDLWIVQYLLLKNNKR